MAASINRATGTSKSIFLGNGRDVNTPSPRYKTSIRSVPEGVLQSDRAKRCGGQHPALGAVQIFQTNVVTQSELLSYMDIYWGLAVLSAVALFLVVFARPQGAASTHLHFHPW